MKTSKKISTLVLQALFFTIVSACGNDSASRFVSPTPAFDPSTEEQGGVEQAETMRIRLPSSAQTVPSDVLDQVIFMGTGGEEGIGCPCMYVKDRTLYLEGFSPNRSLRLVAYEEYQQDFGNYFAEWDVFVDSSGSLAVSLDGYRDTITFVAFDPDTGKQIAPANRLIIAGTPPPATTYAWISDEVTEVNLRLSPGYTNKDDSSDVIVKIPSGVAVEIVDGPMSADGLNWWLVSWNGTQGYVAEQTGSGRTILVFDS